MSATAGREIVISRVISAPRELVFEATRIEMRTVFPTRELLMAGKTILATTAP
jgi:hypothetical protein